MRWLRRVSGIVWIFSWYTIYLEIFRWHHMTKSLRFNPPPPPRSVLWDPIGIYDEHLDFPPDEYDCLIGSPLTKLARHDSEPASANTCGTRSRTISDSIHPVRNRPLRRPPAGLVRSEEPELLTRT
jgi:hypothetical protein